VTRSLAAAAMLLAATAAATAGGCTSVSTARMAPDDLYLGAGVEPIAAIQVDITSAYVLFVPIPGVDLDDAIRGKLLATAEAMGADMVAHMEFRITPSGGVWSLRRLLGWRSARATGIAVRLHLDDAEGTRTGHAND
jgi:hypothetical protein